MVNVVRKKFRDNLVSILSTEFDNLVQYYIPEYSVGYITSKYSKNVWML